MKENSKYLRLTYGILLGIMTCIVGCLFIAYVWDIYVSGNAADFGGTYVFSRERVAERLSKIAPAFWIWVVMIFVGFVLWEVFPEPKRKPRMDVRYTLYRLNKRMPANAEGDLQSSLEAVNRERLILKILWIAVAAVGAGVAIYTIVYLATPSNFPVVENNSKPVFDMVKHVMPAVAAAFACALGVAVYEGVSAKKQLEHVKKLVKGATPAPVKPNPVRVKLVVKAENSKFFAFLLKCWDFVTAHRIAIIRVVVGCVAVSFVIAGACNGSMRDLLNKAINICTECIGLG